jgi:hypothetical protein
MARATRDDIIIGPIPLSSLFTDPRVRDAFRRAERDHGAAFAVPAPSPHLLGGGAAELRPTAGTQSRDLVRVVVATLLLASIFAGAMSRRSDTNLTASSILRTSTTAANRKTTASRRSAASTAC